MLINTILPELHFIGLLYIIDFTNFFVSNFVTSKAITLNINKKKRLLVVSTRIRTPNAFGRLVLFLAFLKLSRLFFSPLLKKAPYFNHIHFVPSKR